MIVTRNSNQPIDALGLTPRQAQVMRLIVKGKCEKTVCKETGLSPGTIKIHTSHALRRLGARNRMEAIQRIAMLAGIDLAARFDELRTLQEQSNG